MTRVRARYPGQSLTEMAEATWKKPSWTSDEAMEMTEKFMKKNRCVNCFPRIGYDGCWHNAWQVPRRDIQDYLEQLFFERITVQVQADKHMIASIIFINDESAVKLHDVIKSIPRVKPCSE